MVNVVNIHGWTVGEPVTKWWRGKYVHLYRLRKACAQCGVGMELDVTKAAVEGRAENAGLHLQRCPRCRETAKTQVARSRPTVTATLQPAAVDQDELEMLRIYKATVAEELQEFDALSREVHQLRLRIAELEGKKPPWQT